MEATQRMLGWLALLAIVYVTLRGSLPRYLSLLGV